MAELLPNSMKDKQQFLNQMNKEIIKIFEKPQPIIIIVGVRGNTKTYSAKKHVLDKAFKGESFCWYYRTKEDIKAKHKKWLTEMPAEYIEAFKTTEKGVFLGVQQVGAFWSIPDFNRAKSGALKNTKFHIFDEFIPENNKYANDELNSLNNLIDSNGRFTEGQKLFMLANSVKSDNPYFRTFKIDVSEMLTNVWENDDIYLIKLNAPPKFKELKNKTLAHKLGNYSNYNEYAENNNWLLDDKNFIIELIYKYPITNGWDIKEEQIIPQINVFVKGNIYGVVKINHSDIYFIVPEIFDEVETFQMRTEPNIIMNENYPPMRKNMTTYLREIFFDHKLKFSFEYIKDDILLGLNNNGY